MIDTRVLVDTSGFVCVLNPDEREYKKAQSLIQDFAICSRGLVTTDYILSETFTLLKARRMQRFIQSFQALIHSKFGPEIKWTGARRFHDIEQFFLLHDDKGYSFTDCLSFIVMREEGITEALTTDRHFIQAGFNALLAAP